MVPRLIAALVFSALLGCARGLGEGRPAAGAAPRIVRFQGMCDASGAVPLGGMLFAVADDEDNVLRVYDAALGGPPRASVDVSAALGLAPRPRRDPEKPAKPAPELDIEDATRVRDLAFWIGSHGRSSSGKRKQERLRLFATTAPAAGRALEVVGSGYDGLLEALLADERYAPFGLRAAAERAPKEPGGLNIEGMAERAAGGVWIGFRSPVPGGHALLAPLENPEQVVHGAAARLGAPVTLDLGGLGVRGLSRWHGSYLIIAGPGDSGAGSRLYRWDGRSAPRAIAGVDLTDLNPEAFFAPEHHERLMLLSDDGSRELDGKECKRLEDPRRKQFRGTWLALPSY